MLAAGEKLGDLPVLVTLIFDEKGKLLTGGTVDSTVAMLEGLRVDALGVNCGLGPKQMHPIIERLTQVSPLPIIVNPNAGLPRSENGKTVFDIAPVEFSDLMEEIAGMGVAALGGCWHHAGASAKNHRRMQDKSFVPTAGSEAPHGGLLVLAGRGDRSEAGYHR